MIIIKLRVINVGNITPQIDQEIDSLFVKERENDEIIDTLCFSIPPEYVWVGLNADIEKVINRKYCEANNVPFVRWFTIGGAYIVSPNSLNFCMVIKETQTLNVHKAFKLFVQAIKRIFPTATLDRNDVLLNGRKISGSSSKLFGKTIYLESSVNIDFDYDRANQILTTKGRENKVLRDWVTSLQRENAPVTDVDSLISLLTAAIANEFNVSVKHGELTDKEKKVLR